MSTVLETPIPWRNGRYREVQSGLCLKLDNKLNGSGGSSSEITDHAVRKVGEVTSEIGLIVLSPTPAGSGIDPGNVYYIVDAQHVN